MVIEPSVVSFVSTAEPLRSIKSCLDPTANLSQVSLCRWNVRHELIFFSLSLFVRTNMAAHWEGHIPSRKVHLLHELIEPSFKPCAGKYLHIVYISGPTWHCRHFGANLTLSTLWDQHDIVYILGQSYIIYIFGPTWHCLHLGQPASSLWVPFS